MQRKLLESILNRPDGIAPAAQYLGQLLEHAPIGVVVLDGAGAVVGWNVRAGAIFEASAPDVVGRPLANLFPFTERPTWHALPDGAGGPAAGTLNEVIERRRADGTPQFVEAITSALPVPSGDAGVLVLVQDVTDRVAAEREREGARRQLAFLADASVRLASSLDVASTLATLARLVVPAQADWCAIDVRDTDGRIRSVVAAQLDAQAPDAFRTWDTWPWTESFEAGAAARVLRTGHAELHASVDDHALAADVTRLREFGVDGPASLLLVPLVARGRTLGVMSLATVTGGRRYGDSDLALADDFARRAALAVDNARLYREVHDAEARFRSLVEGLGAILWEADVPGLGLTFVSPRAAVVFGHPLQRWLGEPKFRFDLVHPDDRAMVVARYRDTLLRGDTDLEYRAITAAGDTIWVHDFIYVIRDDQHRARRLLGLTLDVTQRKRLDAEHAALQAREQEARAAAEASRAKDEFMAVLSHELRTPLNAILGWTRLLRDPRQPAVGDRALAAIERNAQAQVHLVDDLLDMSRIVSGKLELSVRVVDAARLMDAAIDAVRPSIDARGLRLETVVDGAPALVSGDPDRLQQVFWNVLANAVKFTPSHGRIDVRVTRQDDEVDVRVSDTGQGIPPDVLPYVFEPFRQADSTPARRHGGLGLGLALVRHFVELHGGRVAADSAGENHGSTITIRLPAAAAPPAVTTDERPLAAVAGPAPLSGLRVLVVDDQIDSLDLFAAILSGAGAEVIAVESVAKAFAALGPDGFDVVISDLTMPGEDGYALVRRLRQQVSARHLPAIALTASARSEDRTRSLAAGFDQHLSKPVDPAVLVRVVAEAARRAA